MNLQKLNDNFVLSKEKKLSKDERTLLKTFATFKVQHDMDKNLYSSSRKNVLSILNKLIRKTVAVKNNNTYTYFFMTPKKRKTVDYKSVIDSLTKSYDIPKHFVDELIADSTTVTEYDELTIKGDE
tara:strand:- start:257 stop:634 length:378 start_codon:yes stop_codon:yes gene_type:complete